MESGQPLLIVGVIVLSVIAVAAVAWAARVRSAGRAATRDENEAVERAARAESSLARIEAAMTELLGLLPIGVVHLTVGSVVETVNDKALIALDRPRERVIGRPLFEAFADQRLADLAAEARKSGAAHGEVTRDGVDGRAIVVRASGSADGGLWLTFEDASELRRLQRIRAEFIDNLSHELRTPLTSLGLLSETLAREVEAAAAAGDPVTPRMRDRLDKIQLETGHLTQMVMEMLELSRIEAGGPISIGLLDEIDIARLVTSTTERLRTFADRSGVRLVVEAQSRGPVLVRGDEDRLGQVLLNLLHNALKFSPSGAEVVARVTAEATEAVTSISDHGIGIPLEAQARIFERFYKVDRARARGEGGTGLGLAIARHIVDAHGGRIWVESREGVGSTFSFALPLVAAARVAPAEVRS